MQTYNGINPAKQLKKLYTKLKNKDKIEKRNYEIRFD